MFVNVFIVLIQVQKFIVAVHQNRVRLFAWPENFTNEMQWISGIPLDLPAYLQNRSPSYQHLHRFSTAYRIEVYRQ